LKNVLERAVMLTRGRDLCAEHFPGLLPSGSAHGDPDDDDPLRAAERECIQKMLARCGNDVAKAAERLNISRATLYRKLKNGG
jgi:DNA-binding NtrC family response regulator